MKWHDENGEHEQGVTDEQLAKRIKRCNELTRQLRADEITEEQFFAGHNEIEPGLGDLMREGSKEYIKIREIKKRGRKSFQDLGE